MNKITLGFFLAKSKTTLKGLLVLFALLLMNTQASWGQVNIVAGNTITENFDGIGATATAALPAGWKIENVTAARNVVTAYSSVANTATNQALAYNSAMSTTAANGRYNFGGSSAADRAIGGISSSSASQTVNMFLQLTNNGSTVIKDLTINYDAERYRNGTNTAGFSIRVYYSATGLASSWTELTGLVATFGGANADNNGSTTNPMQTINITNKTISQSLAAGSSIYLAWSYSVTSGATTSNAQAVGIDNISITANAPTTTTWNGSSWTYGIPSSTVEAIIDATYNTNVGGIQGPFTAKKLTVTSLGSLTINSGTNVTVQNDVINNGSLVVENNANLIQVNNVANTGSITVNRNSNALKRLDYTLWSSPVSGQSLTAFSSLTSQDPSRFYSFDTTFNTGGVNGAYAAIANPTLATANFSAGAGYLIRMPNTDPTSGYDSGTATLAYPGVFTGTPNNGNVPVTLGYLDAARSYNLVGNPYPSVIDANTFITENTSNIESTLYFWRKTNGSGTAYAAYNPAGGTSTYASTTSEVPNGKIQVGQGFIVQAKSAGVITNFFTNLMRDTSPTSTQFFRTKQVVQKDRVWLNLTNSAGVFSQALVGYFADGAAGVDIYDGKYINDSPIALTSNINNEEYTIQGRPTFDASDIVALNFKTDVAGDYTIGLDHVDGLFSGSQDIYLVDSKTGTETNLKTSSYTFAAAVGVDNSRFSLKYQKTLKVDAPILNDDRITVYKNNGVLYVNSAAKAIKTIKVFDIQGRLIAEQNNLKANTAEIHNLKATHQVLIVKVTSEDNQIISKKVDN